MTVVDLEKLQDMPPEEGEASVAQYRPDRPGQKKLSPAAESDRNDLLRELADSYVKKGLPENLVSGLIRFAISTIKEGQSPEVVQESIESTLATLIKLIPESTIQETPSASEIQAPPIPGAAMGTEAQKPAKMWANLMQQRRKSQKPEVIGGEETGETTPAQFPPHTGRGTGSEPPAQKAA